MKNVMNYIGLVINLVAIFIQAPYIFIAGCIMGGANRLGICSMEVYIWFPTYGVIKAWMRTDGGITCDMVTYKELFH